MRNDSPTQLQDWIARMNAGDEAAKNELLRYAYERFAVWPARCCGKTSPG